MSIKRGSVVYLKNGDGPFNVTSVAQDEKDPGINLVHIFWTDKNNAPRETTLPEDLMTLEAPKSKKAN